MSHNIHPKYRPDIDGLRAVAIALVVLFHAFPQKLTGGFVGVDIFFVISGYLISTIIFNALEQKRFSFRDFYARRVKRIFPAFLTVMIAVLVAAWAFLLPTELHALAKHAFNGMLFIVNINFMQEVGYFETGAEWRPLLHLWSLCIEEQYYLLWPLLVWGFWKFSHRRLYLILPIITASLAACIVAQHVKPLVAFYLPLTRFWELLGGSLLAHLTLRGQGPAILLARGRHVTLDAARQIISILGGLCLVLAAKKFDSGTQFPGYAALLPVIGAMLLIDAGPTAWINKYLLSNRIMIALGLISYPLYLWHWPLLSFGKIVFGRELYGETVAPHIIWSLLAAAVFLATITYRLVERPLRFSPRIIQKTRWLLLGWVVVFAISLMIYFDNITPRLQNTATARVTEAVGNWSYPGNCNFKRTHGFQSYVTNEKSRDVLLAFGDSHMEQYWPRFQHVVDQNPQKAPRLEFMTYGGCAPLPNVRAAGRDAVPCDKFYRAALRAAQQPNVKAVVIGGYWEAYFGIHYGENFGPSYIAVGDKSGAALTPQAQQTKKIFADFAHDLQQLSHMGKHVFVILPNVTSPDYSPFGMIDRLNGRVTHHDVNKTDYLDKTGTVRKLLLDAIHRGGATPLDPVAALCGRTICHVTEDGRPLYKDRDHMRPATAVRHGAFLDVVFEGFERKR